MIICDIPLVSVHQLASWIVRKDKVAVLDIRSFREYHTSHICVALNIGGDRAFKRKLITNPNALGKFLSMVVGVSQDCLKSFDQLVLYDQCSFEEPAIYSDDFSKFIISTTSSIFSNAVLLQGGFLGFRATYPQLCWQHPEKLPDEEFVDVKEDSGLENLLDACISSMSTYALSATASNSQCPHSSTHHPSCSSCGSSSSHQSSDSGIGLGSAKPVEVDLSIVRTVVSRVTAVPVNRPTTIVMSLSFDDVSTSSSRRPSRLRPNTLSPLCPSSMNTSCSSTHLHPPKTAAAPRSRTYDASSHSNFASSYQLVCPPSSSVPVSPPPRFTVSAALSAEAFECPHPTTVLPHLLLGCQGDAMSRETCTEYGITHVINVSVDGEASPHVSPARFLRIPIHDNGKAEIVPFFEVAFKFLDSAELAGGRVLVHCFAGISRSPTLAIAYLMRSKRITFDEAYNRVKNVRKKISPNFNFIGQLTDFQKQLELQSRPPSPSPSPPFLSKPMVADCPPSSSPVDASFHSTFPPIPLVITPTAIPVDQSVPQPAASRDALTTVLHSAPTSSIGPSNVLLKNPIVSRPVSLWVRPPTLKQENCALPVVSGSSKKRDRPEYLSLHPSTPSDLSDPANRNAIVFGRRKRSRIGPLLPSPSAFIASLDLSSPSECVHATMLKSDTPPPPPSPRPRRLQRTPESHRKVDDTRRFSLSAFTESDRIAFSPLRQYEAPSSDIDSDVDMTRNDVFSVSNPMIIGSAGLQSPTSSAHRWLMGDSCRHQQATAESSCHSSLSSSSNGQHTPSFPIS